MDTAGVDREGEEGMRAVRSETWLLIGGPHHGQRVDLNPGLRCYTLPIHVSGQIWPALEGEPVRPPEFKNYNYRRSELHVPGGMIILGLSDDLDAVDPTLRTIVYFLEAKVK